ncbi:hypothetical protein QYE76_055710 [Lolium multiflorum]|uniref:Uncharacterized protein n=1 Tax=Lolium multiflorum TaxID=4521 RepID=A0AAD8T1J9_LOLMU|nr:hypothetical protein QYE76_055710 [Lolium multiflorum]
MKEIVWLEKRRYRRHDRDEEEHGAVCHEKSREQDNNDEPLGLPLVEQHWDSGMSRLPTIGNCQNATEEGGSQRVVFKRLGPLLPQSDGRWADLEDSKTRDKKKEAVPPPKVVPRWTDRSQSAGSAIARRRKPKVIAFLIIAVVDVVGAAPGKLLVAATPALGRSFVFLVIIIILASSGRRRLVGGYPMEEDSSSSSSSSSSSLVCLRCAEFGRQKLSGEGGPPSSFPSSSSTSSPSRSGGGFRQDGGRLHFRLSLPIDEELEVLFPIGRRRVVGAWLSSSLAREGPEGEAGGDERKRKALLREEEGFLVPIGTEEGDEVG